MRYVPSLPPPLAAPEETGELQAVGAVNPAKPVRQRTLVPMVKQHFAEREPGEGGQIAPTGSEIERRAGADRRVYCRRIQQQPVLADLRPGVDRRRRSQRKTDIATSIDEEA
jgi:hypothetical protein